MSLHDAVRAEFEGSNLGDARLNARLDKIATRLAEQPAAGFPTALVTVAETEAFYRFLSNPKVTLEAVLAPHQMATRERCAAAGEVVIAVDRTEMAFKGACDEELEELSAATRGFSTFASLAVHMVRTPDGAIQKTPLGVLDVHPLADAAGRQPASSWAECVARVATSLPPNVRATYVMDREADAFELIAALSKADRSFVVRAKYDRLVADGAHTLKSVVSKEPCIFEREVELSRRSTKGKPPAARAKHPARSSREARLAIRACRVELPRPPKALQELPASLTLNVVLVTEIDPPRGEKPVEWLLLTNLPIETANDLEAVVDKYRMRWMIEEFFKALKTGCAYEDRQLESRKTLLVALGLLVPIAWQLLLIRDVSRNTPKEPASRVLTPLQIRLLQASEDVKLCANPTVEQALLAVARLGGHLKQNGSPGWLVLWRGFEKLRAWEAGALLAMAMTRQK